MTFLLLPLCDQARPWFRFSTRTSSAVGLALCLVALTSATLSCSVQNESRITTGSPSSKYKHRRTLALLRNNQSVRIGMAKKPIVSVTYENERITVKNSLPHDLHFSSRLSIFLRIFNYLSAARQK